MSGAEPVNFYGLSVDLDDALYFALIDTIGQTLAHAAHDAVCQVLASRRDAHADMLAPAPRIYGWQPEMPVSDV